MSRINSGRQSNAREREEACNRFCYMREVCELSREERCGRVRKACERIYMYEARELPDWNINPSASLTLFIYALRTLSRHSREFIPATDTINAADTF